MEIESDFWGLVKTYGPATSPLVVAAILLSSQGMRIYRQYKETNTTAEKADLDVDAARSKLFVAQIEQMQAHLEAVYKENLELRRQINAISTANYMRGVRAAKTGSDEPPSIEKEEEKQ